MHYKYVKLFEIKNTSDIYSYEIFLIKCIQLLFPVEEILFRMIATLSPLKISHCRTNGPLSTIAIYISRFAMFYSMCNCSSSRAINNTYIQVHSFDWNEPMHFPNKRRNRLCYRFCLNRQLVMTS